MYNPVCTAGQLLILLRRDKYTGLDIHDIQALDVLIFSLVSLHDPKYIQEMYFFTFIPLIMKNDIEKLSGQA